MLYPLHFTIVLYFSTLGNEVSQTREKSDLRTVPVRVCASFTKIEFCRRFILFNGLMIIIEFATSFFYFSIVLETSIGSYTGLDLGEQSKLKRTFWKNWHLVPIYHRRFGWHFDAKTIKNKRRRKTFRFFFLLYSYEKNEFIFFFYFLQRSLKTCCNFPIKTKIEW